MGFNKANGDQIPASEWNAFLASAGLYAASATGSDAYAITVPVTPNDYDAGDRYTFKADVANTGAATLNVNGLGVKTIKKYGGTADLATGDIQAGQLCTVRYDGTYFQLEHVERRPVNATLIASGSLSGNNVDIANIPDHYLYLVLVISGAGMDTSSRNIYVRPSVDNGSTFDATAANYAGRSFAVDAATTAQMSAASFLEWSATINSAHTVTGYITIRDYQGLGMQPSCQAHLKNNDTGVRQITDSYYSGSLLNIDALRIIMSSTGNFDAGTYALYGIG